MKKTFMFFILFLITPFLSGQITFEKGYFIDNENNKIECDIKNVDWEYNPASFEYRLTPEEDNIKASLSTVKELVIHGRSKHVRANVNIDRSPTKLNELSNVRNPIWSYEQLFLKVLVEGKATLYYYRTNELNRFFYYTRDSVIQLIFKEYLVGPRVLAANYEFRNQLQNELSCGDTNTYAFGKLGYSKNELIKYFVEYNECKGDTSIIHGTKMGREAIHLKVTPGVNSSSLSIYNGYSDFDNTDFDNEVGFRIGIEAEFILPFNMNKWGIILEPAYQYYNSDKQVKKGITSVKNSYIDLSAGVRHYFFLDTRNNNKIFVNGFISSMVNRDFDSNIDFASSTRTIYIHNKLNFSLGAGVSLNRFSAEIRYYTPQNILDYVYWLSEYNKVAFIFGYKLF